MRLSTKIIVVGVVFFLFWLIFGFLAFQYVLEFGIKDQTALRKRNEVRDIYLKLPFPLDFRVYFFNVSNPMEVQQGSKPILREVGPYCYDEYKEKIDVIDNEIEDSLTYSPYDIYKPNKSRSGCLSHEDYVTIINPFVVGMVNLVSLMSPALLSIVNQAIPPLFGDPQSIYVTRKVKDLLFDGIEIYCNVTEFAGKAVCSQMKSQIPGIKTADDKNILLTSLIGTRNATIGKRMKVGRGIKNSRDLGRVMEVNGKKEINYWSTKECNRYKGTDGWILPPLLKPEEGIWTYSTELCRNMGALYIKDHVMKGVNVRRYEATLGDMSNESDKCYCPTPTTCLKKGVFDLTKCMGVPLYATLPHFLETDETYLEQVIGLKPNHEDHIIEIELEPLTGTPLEVKLRVQVNLPISPNPKITIMKNLPEALHPIFWLEEGIVLEGPLLKKITNIFLALDIFKIVRWICLLIGLAVLGYGLYVYYINKRSVSITPIHGYEESKEDNISRSTNVLIESMRNIESSKMGHTNPVLSGHEFDKYHI